MPNQEVNDFGYPVPVIPDRLAVAHEAHQIVEDSIDATIVRSALELSGVELDPALVRARRQGVTYPGPDGTEVTTDRGIL